MKSPEAQSERSSLIRRLMIFFGLVYFMQGVGQAAGLMSQPLTYFFKEALGLDPAQSTEYLAILTIPWVIKPLYGLVSDFIPLFGYRRKSYLLLMNGLATGAFLWLAGLTAPGQIVTAMFLTALGTAASDVLVDAVMVENGQATGMTKQFQATQWLWFYLASIVTAWLGGKLCEWLEPTSALHTAAQITLFAPLVVMVGTLFLVREQKSAINLSQLKATGSGLRSALKSRTLWAVGLFLAFWNFSPSLGTPFYYHMVDNLHFSQEFIGYLGVYGATGYVVGALAYRRFLVKRLSTRSLVTLSILLGTAGTVSNLLLVTPYLSQVFVPIGNGIALGTVSEVLAVVLTFVFSIASMIALLTLLSMAADACPKQAEGFTFAALMSVFNFAQQISAIVGARLYTYVFDQYFPPLILISAGFTFACFLFYPLLRGVFKLSDKQGVEKED